MNVQCLVVSRVMTLGAFAKIMDELGLLFLAAELEDVQGTVGMLGLDVREDL